MSGPIIHSFRNGYLVLWWSSSHTRPSPTSLDGRRPRPSCRIAPQQVDVGVGGHLAQRVRHRLPGHSTGTFHQNTAPHALELREAAVASSDLAELGVHAPFSPVAGGGHRPLCAQRRVEA